MDDDNNLNDNGSRPNRGRGGAGGGNRRGTGSNRGGGGGLGAYRSGGGSGVNRGGAVPRPEPNNGAATENSGGYQPRCIAPNPERRSETLRMAQEERRDYEAYRQNNRITHVSEVGTVGGGSLSMEESRAQMQQEMNQSKILKKSMKTSWKEEERKREEEECRKKKEEARRVSEQNEERRKRREEEMKKKFEDDHKLVNDDFLSKLEGRTRQVNLDSEPENQNLHCDSVAQSSDAQVSEASLSDAAEATAMPHTHVTRQSSNTDPHVSADQHRQSSNADSHIDVMLTELCALFPHIEPDLLLDALRSADYNMERAANSFLYDNYSN